MQGLSTPQVMNNMAQNYNQEADRYQQQSQAADPVNDFMINAGHAMVNAPQGMDPLQRFSHGLASGTNAMEARQTSNNENSMQALKLKQLGADTLAAVDNYSYNRQLKREEMDMQHQKMSQNEFSNDTDRMKVMGELGAKQQGSGSKTLDAALNSKSVDDYKLGMDAQRIIPEYLDKLKTLRESGTKGLFSSKPFGTIGYNQFKAFNDHMPSDYRINLSKDNYMENVKGMEQVYKKMFVSSKIQEFKIKAERAGASPEEIEQSLPQALTDLNLEADKLVNGMQKETKKRAK